MVIKRLWRFLALSVALCAVWGGVSAQQDVPTALPPSPQLEIQSVTFDEARNSFPVTLLLTNQGLIWELNVKVESTRGGMTVYNQSYAVQANFEIPAKDLTPGEEYRLSVRALDPSGKTIIGFVSSGFGSVQQREIEAEQEFTYPAEPEPQVEIMTVDLITLNDVPAYRVSITQQNTEKIRMYQVWLVDEATGLRAKVAEQLLPVPLVNPVVVPLADLPTGTYTLNIAALDSVNTPLALDSYSGLAYAQPAPDIIGTVGSNPLVIILLVIVTLVLVIAILYATVFKPKIQEYRFGGGFNGYAQPMSTETEERTIDRISRKKREELLQRSLQKQGYAQLEGMTGVLTGQNIILRKFPFSIGREIGDLIVPDMQVSRQHAQILQENGQYYFEDRSSGGSLVNDRKIHQERRALNDGDMIKLGASQIRFRVVKPA